MKKITLAVLALLVIPLISSAQITSGLNYGSRGPQVSELQEFLISKDYLTGSPTGNFFLLTLKAVKAYQADNGLPTTGYVGKLTTAAINNEIATDIASSNEDAVVEVGTSTPTIVVASQDQTPVVTTHYYSNYNLNPQAYIPSGNTSVVASAPVTLPDFYYAKTFLDGTLYLASTVPLNESSVTLVQGSTTISLTNIGDVVYTPGCHESWMPSQVTGGAYATKVCNPIAAQFTYATSSFDKTLPYTLTFSTQDGRDSSQAK